MDYEKKYKDALERARDIKKTNELMVGDWVLDGTQIAQITSITCGGVIETTAHEFSNIEVIEPIPLTLEIMKANGFNIKVAPYTPKWIRCILNPNFFLEDRLKGFYHFNGNNLAKIQYVHELQHALRLCGIEKEIQL